MNNNKSKSLVVGRFTTVNPPHGDLVLSTVSICSTPYLVILCVRFDTMLIFEDHVSGIFSRVSQRIGILRLVKRIFLDTSVLLCCYYFLPILRYCSPVWGSAAEGHLQLLERQVYSVAKLCPDRTLVVASSTSWCCTVYGVQGLFDTGTLDGFKVAVNRCLLP